DGSPSRRRAEQERPVARPEHLVRQRGRAGEEDEELQCDRAGGTERGSRLARTSAQFQDGSKRSGPLRRVSGRLDTVPSGRVQAGPAGTPRERPTAAEDTARPTATRSAGGFSTRPNTSSPNAAMRARPTARSRLPRAGDLPPSLPQLIGVRRRKGSLTVRI